LSFSPAANADHLLDQVDAGRLFRHRMLDLQPRVHLEEVEALAGRVRAGDDELDRPRRVIAEPPGPARRTCSPIASRISGT
jgi:hypothetical protein